MDAAPEKINNPNSTYPSFPNDSKIDNFLDNYAKVTSITLLVIAILGAVGNGTVFWLLGFRMKRNPFMTYILNLAIADLGVLLSAIPHRIILILQADILYISVFVMAVSFYLFLLMYSASQFLLTAISIDRCVAVFFPLWHRCHRPPYLSTIVCQLIWVLSVLLSAITCTLRSRSLNLHVTRTEISYQFILNVVLCLPVMAIATVSLFIKVCLKAQQCWRGKLLTIVLVTLLFFLLFAFPLNVMCILSVHGYLSEYIQPCTVLLAILNSSVNPVIYFLVGRQWKPRCRESMKMILQKVFQEEEAGEEETPVETQV